MLSGRLHNGSLLSGCKLKRLDACALASLMLRKLTLRGLCSVMGSLMCGSLLLCLLLLVLGSCIRHGLILTGRGHELLMSSSLGC